MLSLSRLRAAPQSIARSRTVSRPIPPEAPVTSTVNPASRDALNTPAIVEDRERIS